MRLASAILATWPAWFGQDPAALRETWSDWFAVRTGVPHPHSSAGWLRPPDAGEFHTEDPIPSFFIDGQPIVKGRLILRRGGVLEAWDVEKKALAWKLRSATGLLGWKLIANRVTFVLPGGPAARAGVVEGDLVTAFNGTRLKVGDSVPRGIREGEKGDLELTAGGGVRHAALVAGQAPEPFGDPPKFAAQIGEDYLIERDGRVERVRSIDGSVLWSQRGRFIGQGADLVLLGSSDEAFAVDAAKGGMRWKADLSVGSSVKQAVWTDRGPIILSTHPAFRVDRLDGATGRRAWSYCRGRSHEGDVHVFPSGRVFVSAADEDCQSWSAFGGVPLHDGPTCRTYALLDLESGEQVWGRRTGGRPHGGSHRMEAPKYIPFDPHLGGPAAAWGDRLLWFDLTGGELSVLDPATLGEVHRLKISGANQYSRLCPPGTIGVNTDRGLVWIDPASGKTTRLGIFPESASEPAVVGRRVLEAAGDPDLGTQEIRALEGSGTEPKVVWAARLPKNTGVSIAASGERALLTVDLHLNDHDLYSLRDAASGRELLSVTLDNPPFWYSKGVGRGARGTAILDPYLVLSTTYGIHVYRRDHARRDD